MKGQKIIIPGGTGFIGQAIAKYFGRENHIIILTRKHKRDANNRYGNNLLSPVDGLNLQYVEWDGKTVQKHWQQHLDGADIVINLTGKSVNCRYHSKNQRAIITSRQAPTNAIGQAIRETVVPPKLWINAASSTIYKNTLDTPQDEFTGEISELKNDNMPYSFLDRVRRNKNKLVSGMLHGRNSLQCKELEMDFSVKVCKLWEAAFFEQRTPFTRKVALRTAIALGTGGVITPYLKLLKFGLGGRHGNGRQKYSWVHVTDVCRMIDWLWERKDLEGVFNCVSPNAVTNSEFMQTLRNITGHRVGLPAPDWMLELGALMIGTETELMLKSRWVVPTRALKEGFVFQYPTLHQALQAIISALPRKAYHLF